MNKFTKESPNRDHEQVATSLVLGSDLGWLRPYVVPDLVRVGGRYDGGYVVPESSINGIDAVVSFGVFTDWSFEAALHERNGRLPIHSYDHTVGRARFAKWEQVAAQDAWKALVKFGLGRMSRAEVTRAWTNKADARRLRESYERFFQDNRVHFEQRVFNRHDTEFDATIQDVFDRLPQCRKIFLKMDIEGGEYRVLGDVMKYADRIRLLVVEFHQTDPLRHVMAGLVEMLSDRFRIVHVHGNNSAPIASDGLPEVLEITFARLESVLSNERRSSLPLEGLDSPCEPSRPEICLKWME